MFILSAGMGSLVFSSLPFWVIKIWSNGGNGGAPWWSYWSTGITNMIGPAMGIEALKYISYPAQCNALFDGFLSSNLQPGSFALMC